MEGDLLLHVLKAPGEMAGLSEEEWDRLLRLARTHRLLARLEPLARDQGIWQELPERARDNIRGAQAWVDHFQLRIRRELMEVRKVLRHLGVPLLLLKGAAYMAEGLPPARGRSLSDLDLLVRRQDLPRVERALLDAGWKSEIEDDYDQRYYREWMHEIPPLVHLLRGVEVDIHHNLLPRTGRYQVPIEKLWEAARPLEANLSVLAPADMLLHSAAHLVVSDELRGGLRDLFDIHQLYIHFSAGDARFPRELPRRARELGLSRPLWYVVQAAHRLFDTPFSPEVLDPAGYELPGPVTGRVMRYLVRETLRPRAPEAGDAAFQRWLLYLRSHWIRMPPGLLAMHLARKSIRRLGGRSAGVAGE